MRVAFITSCLEPGQDGVGDYTRLLAQECRRQGHECCAVAINDRYVLETLSDTSMHLRLAAGQPWHERINITQQMLKGFAPDWISLQFVPYAFHPKGLVFGLARNLRSLFHGRQSQIMFHELWIGAQQGASHKHRLVGSLQQHLMTDLIKQLKPNLIHTSNITYIARLEQQNITAKLLPLFGNVAVTHTKGNAWLFAELSAGGVTITDKERDDFWFVGFFGSIPPYWPPEPVFTYLHHAAVDNGRKVVIWSIGRLGTGQHLWERLAEQYRSKFRFIELGEQPEEKVSQYLNSMDFGFAAAPQSLIGKSGSTAAMMEHGLPVIVNRDDEHFNLPVLSNFSDEPLLHPMSVFKEQVFVTAPPHASSASRLPGVANQFLQNLCAASRK